MARCTHVVLGGFLVDSVEERARAVVTLIRDEPHALIETQIVFERAVEACRGRVTRMKLAGHVVTQLEQ